MSLSCVAPALMMLRDVKHARLCARYRSGNGKDACFIVPSEDAQGYRMLRRCEGGSRSRSAQKEIEHA